MALVVDFEVESRYIVCIATVGKLTLSGSKYQLSDW